MAAHVWRCSLTLAKGEKLSFNQWEAATARFVTEMGFEDCEWVAVHHGGSGRENLDHVHLTVNVIQATDGKAVKLSYDRPRAQAAAARLSRELVAIANASGIRAWKFKRQLRERLSA